MKLALVSTSAILADKQNSLLGELVDLMRQRPLNSVGFGDAELNKPSEEIIDLRP